MVELSPPPPQPLSKHFPAAEGVGKQEPFHPLALPCPYGPRADFSSFCALWMLFLPLSFPSAPLPIHHPLSDPGIVALLSVTPPLPLLLPCSRAELPVSMSCNCAPLSHHARPKMQPSIPQSRTPPSTNHPMQQVTLSTHGLLLQPFITPCKRATPPATHPTGCKHAAPQPRHPPSIAHTPSCSRVPPEPFTPLRPRAPPTSQPPPTFQPRHHTPPTLHPPTSRATGSPLHRVLPRGTAPLRAPRAPPPPRGGGTGLPIRRTAARGRPLPALSPPSRAARGGGGGGGGGAGGADVTAARGRRYLRRGAGARAPLRRIRGARRRRRWRRRPPPAPPPRRRPRTMRSARALLLALALRVCALDSETPSGERGGAVRVGGVRCVVTPPSEFGCRGGRGRWVFG